LPWWSFTGVNSFCPVVGLSKQVHFCHYSFLYEEK